MDVYEVLTDGERADLARVARRYAPAGVAILDGVVETDGTLERLGYVYIEARVAGLCREGALELFEDALREGS